MPSVHLDETQRIDVCIACCFMYLLCCLLSGGIIGFALEKVLLLQPFTSLVEGYNAKWLWIVMLSDSAATFVVSIFGIYLCLMQIYPHRRHQYLVMMAFCTALTFCVAVTALVCSLVCYLHVTHLGDEFRGSLVTSMKRYRDNENVKRLIDQLQMNFQCCGSNKYTDWFQIAWIAEEFVDTAEPDVRDQIHTGIGYQTDSTPFSCCNMDSRRPCIHRDVHENSKHYNYDYQKQLTLYKVGCLLSLERYISIQLVNIGIAFLVLFVLEITVFVLTRFMHTSAVRAIQSGEPTAAAKGVVFGFGGASSKPKTPKSSGPPSSVGSVPTTPGTSRPVSRAPSGVSIGGHSSSTLARNTTKHNVNEAATTDTDDDANDIFYGEFFDDVDPDFDIIKKLKRDVGYDGNSRREHLLASNQVHAAADDVEQRQRIHVDQQRPRSTFYSDSDLVGNGGLPVTDHRGTGQPYLGPGPPPVVTERCKRSSTNASNSVQATRNVDQRTSASTSRIQQQQQKQHHQQQQQQQQRVTPVRPPVVSLSHNCSARRPPASFTRGPPSYRHMQMNRVNEGNATKQCAR